MPVLTFSSCWQMPLAAGSVAHRKPNRLRTELFAKEEHSWKAAVAHRAGKGRVEGESCPALLRSDKGKSDKVCPSAPQLKEERLLRTRRRGSTSWLSPAVWRSAVPYSQQGNMHLSLESICSFPAFLLVCRRNGLPVLFLGFWLKHPVQSRTVPCQLLDRLSTLSWHVSSYVAPKGLHSQNPSILETASTLFPTKQSRCLSAFWWAITSLAQAPCHSFPAAAPQKTRAL